MVHLNFKQEELIEELLAIIKKNYPESDLIEITESSENPQTLWIKITAPKDLDKKIALSEFAADKCTDILCDYGYHMLVMPLKRFS